MVGSSVHSFEISSPIKWYIQVVGSCKTQPHWFNLLMLAPAWTLNSEETSLLITLSAFPNTYYSYMPTLNIVNLLLENCSTTSGSSSL